MPLHGMLLGVKMQIDLPTIALIITVAGNGVAWSNSIFQRREIKQDIAGISTRLGVVENNQTAITTKIDHMAEALSSAGFHYTLDRDEKEK